MSTAERPSDEPCSVTIIVVTLNGRAHLERCLASLTAQSYQAFEIILVDNASSDDTLEWVSAQYPRIQTIRNLVNLGFAPANNQGIRAARTPFVVTLNNDTEAEAGWLAALVAAAGSAPDVGMCASLVLQAYNPNLVDSAGICIDWTGAAWNRGYGQRLAPEWLRPGPVWGPSGAAALYKRTMLEEIGLFDEEFFAYYEDVDLAWRANLLGWRCLHVPTARVYHVHSATLGQFSPLKQYYISRNKIWCLLKNYPAPAFWYRLPLIILADLLALVYRCIRTPVSGRSALRGRFDAWRALPHVLHKRGIVQRLRRHLPSRQAPQAN